MDNKNFVFSERVKFQYILDNRLLLNAIDVARDLNKSRSTIYYELKNFSLIKHNTYNDFNLNGVIRKAKCSKLNRFPFVCNGCPKYSQRCSFDKNVYDAYIAQDKAHKQLVNTRTNTSNSRKTVKVLNSTVIPLIKDGISIHVAKNSVNNCPYSESTIRRYIESGLVNAKRIDLPRAVRFRVKKEYKYDTPKLDINALNGRTYDDFKKYIEDHPNARIIELDSVVGKRNDKTALLTIYFRDLKFQFGFLYNKKHSKVNDYVVNLYCLARKYYIDLFDVILTDNGSEFKTLYQIESQIYTKVFYCDPYASYQKAECEKNHGFFRRIVPKSKSLDKFNQEEINDIFSHINSYPRASLNNKSPYDLFTLRYNSIILDELGICLIPVSKIRLKYINK